MLWKFFKRLFNKLPVRFRSYQLLIHSTTQTGVQGTTECVKLISSRNKGSVCLWSKLIVQDYWTVPRSDAIVRRSERHEVKHVWRSIYLFRTLMKRKCLGERCWFKRMVFIDLKSVFYDLIPQICILIATNVSSNLDISCI